MASMRDKALVLSFNPCEVPLHQQPEVTRASELRNRVCPNAKFCSVGTHICVRLVATAIARQMVVSGESFPIELTKFAESPAFKQLAKKTVLEVEEREFTVIEDLEKALVRIAEEVFFILGVKGYPMLGDDGRLLRADRVILETGQMRVKYRR